MMLPTSIFAACLLALLFAVSAPAWAGKITVAAASDLKYAMDQIIAEFHLTNPGDRVKVVYSSSGKLYNQIRNGAPYDLFFSADITYLHELNRLGHVAGEVHPYALGRIVLWRAAPTGSRLTLESLAYPATGRIAIANPRHAPYGKRAEEALRNAGLLQKVAPRLVYGESVAHAAQFVQTGNASVGIIALSLAMAPELARQGEYWLIPQHLYQPLEQGYIITRKAADSALAARFASYMESPAAHAVMQRYGFVLLGEATAR